MHMPMVNVFKGRLYILSRTRVDLFICQLNNIQSTKVNAMTKAGYQKS